MADFFVGHLGKVAEVEAQALVIDQRAFLLDMAAQNLPQGGVHQVRCAVVVGNALTACRVDGSGKSRLGVLWQLLGDVDDEVVLLHRINNTNGFVFGSQGAGVAHLTAHFGVERGLVQHDLKVFLLLGDHLAEAQDVTFTGEFGVADKLGGLFALVHHHPVAVGFFGGFARAVFLLFEVSLEAVHIHVDALFGGHQLGKVDREAEGVEQFEGEVAVNVLILMLFHITLETFDALRQGAQECGFLLADDLADQLLLRLDFGEVVLHLLHKDGQKVAHKRLFEAQKSETIAHGATQHAADDITSPVVRR